MKYTRASLEGGNIKIYRIGRCPDTGEWCTSSCYVYGTRHNQWKIIGMWNYPKVNWKRLRNDLYRGENHIIDVSHITGEGLDHWEWIDRAEDLSTKEQIDKWVKHLQYLIRNHRRLLLYGDTHGYRSTLA